MAHQTIVAYFDTRSEAETAQAALAAEGIDAGSIQLLPETGSTYARGGSETAYDHRRDEGGFWGSLGGLSLPDEDRYTYAEGMSRGGVALSVTTDDARYDRVAEILERNGAVDLDTREAEWRSAGWTGYTGMDQASTTTNRAAPVNDEGVVQVVEEQLRVGKRQLEKGRVRVRSYVVETPVQEQVELRSERVVVERRPVDRAATADDLTPADRVLEAEERAEEAVVSKEARVVEEIGLRKEVEQHAETVSDTVRHTEVEIEDDRTGATRVTETDRDLSRR
jgi:uncharacterized protein (TIGR02271 family)